MPIEQWKKCQEFPHYEVSSIGRVRRIISVRGKRCGMLRPFLDRGYPTFKLRRDGKTIKAYVHRLVGQAFHGLTADKEIDHKFHDLSDVSNIRIATRAQNARNARGQKDHTSKFKGVSWSKSRQKWYACICIDGEKTKSLGCYEEEEVAAKVYDAAAEAAWGDFAFLNFPYDPDSDFVGSLDVAYGAIRERVAAGGPPWTPREP